MRVGFILMQILNVLKRFLLIDNWIGSINARAQSHGCQEKGCIIRIVISTRRGNPRFQENEEEEDSSFASNARFSTTQELLCHFTIFKVTFLSCFLMISFLLMEVFVDSCWVFLVHFISPGCDIIFLKGGTCLQSMVDLLIIVSDLISGGSSPLYRPYWNWFY